MIPVFERIYEYCMGLPGVTEGFPFGQDVLVLRVGGKMFLLAGLEDIPMKVNLKCDPERAIELREQYPSIIPGYHMNKQQWNTCLQDGGIPAPLMMELVDHSYELVRASLPKKIQDALDGDE